MQSNTKSRTVNETLSDLHTIFVWGERAVPFLEDLMQFIDSITPLIDEINHSLNDSTKRFPSAQSQLNSVTKATELATNEILSLLEKSLNDCDVIDKETKESLNQVAKFSEFKTSLRSEIRSAISESDPRVHVLHAKLWHQTDKLVTQLDASGETKKKMVSALRSGLNKILMSLQVQDITTQQISSVNHVIQSVRSQLTQLHDRLNTIKYIEGPDFSLSESSIESREALGQSVELRDTKEAKPEQSEKIDENGEVIPLESGSTFDANATYDKATSVKRQREADDVVQKIFSGEVTADVTGDENSEDPSNEGGQEVASSDDIDSLFASGGDTASSDDIDKLFSGDGDAASSDDIDKLFAGDGGPASNDDIDKLFGP